MDKRLTVAEAAQRLGITTEALRQRIRRGSVHSEKLHGRLYVVLTASNGATDAAGDERPRDDTTPDEDGPPIFGRDDGAERELIDHLKRENERLWRELERREEEIHRRDVLLREALQSRPSLPATSSAMGERGSPPALALGKRWWWPFGTDREARSA